MGKLIMIDDEYRQWVVDLTQRIKQRQFTAVLHVNSDRTELYWSIGADIVERQAESKWGSGVIPQLSKDLQKAFPSAEGFSDTNLKYMKRFYLFYTQDSLIGQTVSDQLGCSGKTVISQTVSDQLQRNDFSGESDKNVPPPMCLLVPWSHNIIISGKSKGYDEASFYIQQSIENNWSSRQLAKQIKDDVYSKHGIAPNNFQLTLPDWQSGLAVEITKDPYNFDFTSSDLRDRYQETELEDALIRHITEFLLELGTGFAYLGRQIKLNVGAKKKKLDLLFYHVNLHCYVAVELKTGEFDSVDIGQLGTYVSAVNHQFKKDGDNQTVGLLICKNKDNTLAQYALEGSAHPIGISEYELTNIIPEDYKSVLPSIEEIEAEMKDIDANEHEGNYAVFNRTK
jgi:predicted nuclease of restriction endonuclease-like (RecB) superfamily